MYEHAGIGTLLVGLAGAALAWNAIAGIRTGKALMIYKQVERSADPIGFWTAVSLSASLAVAAGVSLLTP